MTMRTNVARVETARPGAGASIIMVAGRGPGRAGSGAPAPHDDADTPLMVACREGDMAGAQALLARGSSAGAASHDGWTALAWACVADEVMCAELLISHGASTDGVDHDGQTPLHRAAAAGSDECVRLLLCRGVHVNARACLNQWTPLMEAARGARALCVRLLLDALADARVCTASGDCALSLACASSCEPAVRMLLHGAAPDELSEAVHAASRAGAVECARAVLDASTARRDVDVRLLADGLRPSPPTGCSSPPSAAARDPPIVAACRQQHWQLAALLIQRRADVRVEGVRGESALLLACRGRHLPTIQLLSAHGAPRAFPGARTTALRVAEASGADGRTLRWLSDTRRWVSPLHHVELLRVDEVYELLRAGADIRARTRTHDAPTPLGLALDALAAGRAEPDPTRSAAALIAHAAGPWSPQTHALFPPRARARAVRLLLLSYLLAADGERFGPGAGALADLFLEKVLPRVITRYSR